ncbi:hypothetical protein BH10PSE1_BH10PSE1_16150 [soil metagenome]
MKQIILLPLLLAAAGLSACGTTAARPVAASAPLASGEDCQVIAQALELFDRPHDGSGLAVMEVAPLEVPAFQAQKPEQRANGPISLRSCALTEVRLVNTGPAVQLWRPEIHDDMVLVGYQETATDSRIHAVLERTAEGGWRNKGALLGQR